MTNLDAPITLVPGAAEAAEGAPTWLAEAARPRPTPLRSRIASANALFRFAETQRPPAEQILSDPWARALAEGVALQAVRYLRFLAPPLQAVVSELQTAHCVRHRAIDELILRAVREGYRQVVVLGAGYDMRASRFADRLGGVSWFEVDLPTMSARKRQVVARLGGTHRDVRYLPIDLAAAPLAPALARGGFDPAQPACFVLEGLIHYLSAEGFDRLLADLAAGAGPRRAVFSFIRSDVYLAARSPLRHLFKWMREIPRLHFTRTELAHLCARHGLRRFEAWSFADQIAAFAPMAAGRRVGSTQDVGHVEKAG